MASELWLRTILIVRKETRCCHRGYSFQLTAGVLLYAPSHIQDSTYHGLCYTSRGALAGTRNSSMGSPHEGSVDVNDYHSIVASQQNLTFVHCIYSVVRLKVSNCGFKSAKCFNICNLKQNGN